MNSWDNWAPASSISCQARRNYERSGSELGPYAPFPAPWTVKELDACFVVRDHNGQALAYVYFEDEPGRLPNRVC
jgi:hypothetical protein